MKRQLRLPFCFCGEKMSSQTLKAHALPDRERLTARPKMKVIIATETTRFAGRGRNSPRWRNAKTTLHLIGAMPPFGAPGPGRTIEELR
jgi:hypothetical protein